VWLSLLTGVVSAQESRWLCMSHARGIPTGFYAGQARYPSTVCPWHQHQVLVIKIEDRREFWAIDFDHAGAPPGYVIDHVSGVGHQGCTQVGQADRGAARCRSQQGWSKIHVVKHGRS
jgi:hypothetical protein